MFDLMFYKNYNKNQIYMSSFLTFKSFVRLDENKQESAKRQNYQSHSASQVSRDPQIGSFVLDINTKSQKRIKKQGIICNFISKVYNMLQQKEIQHIVSWVENKYIGSQKKIQGDPSYQDFKEPNPCSFQIIDVRHFQENILPKYFKHSNLSSFVRQLNMYGFHKLRGQKAQFQFQHQKFQKSRKDLLSQIRRKSPQLISLSTTSIPEGSHRIKPSQSKVLFSSSNFAVQQNGIKAFKQQKSDNQIFPSQGFISAQNYAEKGDILETQVNKIEKLEQQNALLRQLKHVKMQRIKELGGMNRNGAELKLAKMVYTLMTQQLKNQSIQRRKPKQIAHQPKFKNMDCLHEKKPISYLHKVDINQLAEHILSNQTIQKFSYYSKRLLQRQY